MLEQRQALVEERRKAAIATKAQKESLSRIMEEVRTNASKAGQIISKVMSGKLTLDQLASQGLDGSMHRSKSASKRRSHSGGKSQSPVTADQLGLGGERRSQSAGQLASSDASADLFKYSLKPGDVHQQTYVSPYAVPAGQV
jgi:hypothetical protein